MIGLSQLLTPCSLLLSSWFPTGVKWRGHFLPNGLVKSWGPSWPELRNCPCDMGFKAFMGPWTDDISVFRGEASKGLEKSLKKKVEEEGVQ